MYCRVSVQITKFTGVTLCGMNGPFFFAEHLLRCFPEEESLMKLSLKGNTMFSNDQWLI